MRLLTWTVPALVALAGLSPLVVKGDEKKQENPLEAYEKAGRPGPQHKLLEPMAGRWEWSGKFWMEPGAEPVESKGTAVRTWILGGRFLRDETESAGGPFGDFKGIGYNGYDNLRKKYTSSWMDSMSTCISVATGTADRAGKVFTWEREDLDPVSGKAVKGRDVVRIVSDDEHRMEMYKSLPDGKEMKVMELVFKRVSK